MKTINLDTEIVGTCFDPVSRKCSYTIARDGRRWTVYIHIDELNRHGGNKKLRRDHLGKLLMDAMRGKADSEK